LRDRAGATRTRILVEEQPGGTSEVWLELEGRRVSRVVIIPMLMRIGAAVVRMDGIGGVETDEGHRQRGYARRVMGTALELIRAGDGALSTLFGIEDFYQKFGYETVGPEYTVAVPLHDAAASASALPPGWQFRPVASDDLLAMMRLYHANTKRATGALVRHDAGDDPAETARLAGCNPNARKIGLRAWHMLEKVATEPAEDACRALLDERGDVAAYAWRGRGWYMDYRRRDMPEAFHLAEAMARDPMAADALLAACRLWADETDRNFAKVAFAIPPEGPLAAAAAYEGGQITAVYTRGGDFMGRVLDVERLLRQLLPELAARTRAAKLSFRGCLRFATDEGAASLSIAPDGVSMELDERGRQLTVELPQTTLARLCLGGFDPGDLLARLPKQPDYEAASLLQTLFPRRTPHIYPMDRF
jgi:predicted N-acetyltransferase YhbS